MTLSRHAATSMHWNARLLVEGPPSVYPGVFARLRSLTANILRSTAFITSQMVGIASSSAASVQSSPCASCIECVEQPCFSSGLQQVG